MSNFDIAYTMVKTRSRIIDLRKKKSGLAEGRSNIQISFPERRRSPLRARKRKLRMLAALVVVILSGGALMGVSALSYLPKYSVTSVNVSGAEIVSPKLIRAYAETKLNDGTSPIISRQNIFLYPREEIEKGITGYFPRIQKAEVERNSMLAQAVTVKLTERNPFALWCSDDQECFLMDESGFIFARAESSAENTDPIFRGGLSVKAGITASETAIGQTFLPGRFAGMLDLFDRLRKAGFAPTGASVHDDQDFTVSFSEGFLLRAAFAENATALVRNLQLSLTAEPVKGKVNKLEYIDLRFGNRVYYKFK